MEELRHGEQSSIVDTVVRLAFVNWPISELKISSIFLCFEVTLLEQTWLCHKCFCEALFFIIDKIFLGKKQVDCCLCRFAALYLQTFP